MRALILLGLCACTLELPVKTGESGLDSAPWEDPDGDGYPGDGDCQPDDFTSNPAAPERCDGVDNDCDGETDEDDAEDAITWYSDADGDGHGGELLGRSCDEPEDSSDDARDCDDTDDTVFGGAEEICGDGKDNDCDGTGCRWEGELSAEDTMLWRVNGDQYGSYTGKAVALLPDLDGDGAADLALTAPGEDVDTDDQGALFLFRGPLSYGTSSVSAADATWSGGRWQYAGYSVAGLGDVGGEGRAAVGLGAMQLYVWIFVDLADALGAGAEMEPDLTLTDTDDESGFGREQAGDGDMNGDGALELAVSASLGEGGRGRLGIYAQDPEEIFGEVGRVLGDAVGDAPGTAMAFADLDGDGLDELLAGAPGLDAGATDGGGVYLVDAALREGGSLADASALLVEQEGCAAGQAVAAPDADGDGYDDLLVGGPGCSNRYGEDGSAWLAAGSDDALTVGPQVIWTLEGQEKAHVGASVASGGDMDGDGADDPLVGAPNWTVGGSYGALLIWYGPVEGVTTSSYATARFQSSAADEIFGYSLAGGADLTGDGLPDFAAGGISGAGGYGMARLIPGLNL